jgi:6-phosphogluconolactonase
MPADPRTTIYASPAALAQALAAQISAELQQAIAARGKALLVISGGTTPRRLLETLSQASLDWPAVTVTLADERWVPDSDPRRHRHLLQRHALGASALRDLSRRTSIKRNIAARDQPPAPRRRWRVACPRCAMA